MKNIKLIPSFFMSLCLIVSSCAIDNDPAVIPMGQTVTATLDKTGEIYAHAGSEISVGFVLSRTIAEPTLFTYTLNGVENSIELIQGQQSVTLSLPNVIGETNTIVLTAAHGLNNNTVSVGSTNTSVTFIGVPAPTPGYINVSYGLNDPAGAFYFTFAAFDSNGNWITDVYGGTSANFAIPITSSLVNSAEIVPQYFAIDIFSLSLNDSGYSIYIVYPDASVLSLSGNNLDLAGFVDQDVVLVDVSDDPATPGDKIYSFTQN